MRLKFRINICILSTLKLIFVGIKWKGNPYRPFVEYCEINGNIIKEKELKIGSKFNIKFLVDSYCIGSEVGKGLWISCAENRLQKQLEPKTVQLNSDKEKQCSICLNENFFTCRMTCTGTFCQPSSPQAKEACTPPKTSVYLTSVAGKKKVGVSLSLPRRWIEQGSDFAVKIVEAPGLEARRIEQILAQELELNLSVRNNHKIKHLAAVSKNTGTEILEGLINESQKILDQALPVNGKKIEHPEILDLGGYFGNSLANLDINEKIAKPGDEFGGEVYAVKGSILVVRQERYFYALNLKSMISKTFSFLNSDAKMDTQTSLNEWF